jgi:hypothetical protein
MVGADRSSPSFLYNCLLVVSVAVLYYDHALTLSDEVRLVWGHLSARSSWLFLMNRYLAFFGYLAVLVFSYITMSEAGCKRFHTFRQGLLVASVIIITCEYLNDLEN